MLIAKSTRNGSFSIAMLHTPTIPNTCLPDVSGSPAEAKSLAASVLAGLGSLESLVMWCGSGSFFHSKPLVEKKKRWMFIPPGRWWMLFWPIPMCLVYQGMWRLPIGHVTSCDFYLPYKTSKQPWYTCIPDDTTQTNRKFRWVTTWDVPSWQQHEDSLGGHLCHG